MADEDLEQWQMKLIKDLEPFDILSHLKTPKMIAAYLSEFVSGEKGDDAILADSLGKLSKEAGMSVMAKKSGLARESLYKALRSDSQPKFDTIAKVINALGYDLVVVPKKVKK